MGGQVLFGLAIDLPFDHADAEIGSRAYQVARNPAAPGPDQRGRARHNRQERDQGHHIAARAFAVPPKGGGGLGGSLTNRKGAAPGAMPKAGRTGHASLGRENGCGKHTGLDRVTAKDGCHQRRNHHARVRSQPVAAGGGKAAGLRFGPRDQDRGIVCHGHGCYLPNTFWAITAAMTNTLNFLGIESSCDDTAAAVVRSGPSATGRILSSVVYGQADLHADFGGIVPEIAARAHTEKLDVAARRALDAAEMSLSDIDAIAVTAGPGLIGGVLAGVMFAKGLAAGADIPLIGVNHLAGHALTPRLTDNLAYPYLMLLVSGGHCQFLTVSGPQKFRRLGGTIDDAPGEAFDKIARLIGLAQANGPAVETAARTGDAARFSLPRPLLDRPGCDMSFSGLKTAVLRARNTLVDDQGGLTHIDRADLAASFQAAVTEVLAEKSRRALAGAGAVTGFAVAGGVSANLTIRNALLAVAQSAETPFVAPPLALCTDNAAMIAWAGIEAYRAGHRDDFRLAARPRWPLDSTAPALLGSGKKGAKA